MLRSMYSGISGMRVNQTKLDVAGNNIANVGTTGFKSSRVRFQDMLSQNVSEALGPGRNTGGVNPRQVGLGVQVAGIDTIVTQGMMQPTGRNLDVAVDGTGYFMVAKGAIPNSNAAGISVDPAQHTISGSGLAVSFTRDGSFTLDQAGNLLTSDGYRVMGYALQEKSGPNANAVSIDYGKNGLVSFVDSDSKDGLVATQNLVSLRIPDSVHVSATNIKKADSTNTPPIPPLYMDYTGTGTTIDIDGSGNNLEHTTIDTNNNEYVGNVDLKIEVKWAEDPSNAGTNNWRVFVNGEDICEASSAEIYVAKDGTVATVAPVGTEGTDFTQINIGDPDSNIPSGQEEKYTWSATVEAEKDKKIRSFSIEKEGLVKAVLDDGSVAALGQLAIASFKNPGGLKKTGKNLLENTANSGQPIIRSGVGGDPALDNGDGYGDMLQGMLEMSNVDLAEQFTDMIVTQRAFQASSKMISTGDEILQEIINLKR